MKNTIKLPQSQRDIIVKALKTYQTDIRTVAYKTDDQHHTNFDITTLIVVFKDEDVDLRIELDQEIHDSFAHRHGVDFPQYV